MSPFERWFAEDFDKLLRECAIPANVWATPPATPPRPEDASWDRRAAFLLWEALGRPEPATGAPKLTDDGY